METAITTPKRCENMQVITTTKLITDVAYFASKEHAKPSQPQSAFRDFMREKTSELQKHSTNPRNDGTQIHNR